MATKVDMVAELPLEVSTFVLSLLGLPDLGRAARVSRAWNEVTGNDVLWRVLYEQRYRRAPPGGRPVPTFVDAFRASGAVAGTDTDQGQSRKDAFRNKTYLEDRWHRGHYHTSSFRAHEFSVNGLKFLSTEHAPPVRKEKKATKKGRADARKDRSNVEEDSPVSNSSMVLLTWSDDFTIKVWHPHTVTPSWPLAATEPCADCSLLLNGHTSLVFSADSDGRIIVSGGMDEKLIVWSMATGEILTSIPETHKKGLEALQLHQNRVVSCGGTEPITKLWDIETAKCVGCFEGHKGRVFTLAANFEENLLVTAGSGSTFRCWDMRTRECIVLVTNKSARFPQNMNEVLHLNGPLLATGDSAGDVKIWDLRQLSNVDQEGFWLTPLTTYNHGSCNISHIWSDYSKMVTVGGENVLKFWEFDRHSLHQPSHTTPLHEVHIPSVWRMQGDERALVCGARNGSITMLDFGSEEGAPQKKKNCLLQ